MATLGSDASPQEPPSRRLILKNTLQLLAATGLVSVSGEQVRGVLPGHRRRRERRCVRQPPACVTLWVD